MIPQGFPWDFSRRTALRPLGASEWRTSIDGSKSDCPVLCPVLYSEFALWAKVLRELERSGVLIDGVRRMLWVQRALKLEP